MPQAPLRRLLALAADSDLVTILQKDYYRQDPKAAPGTWSEGFTLDVFRVGNGKPVEHRDGGDQPSRACGGQQ